MKSRIVRLATLAMSCLLIGSIALVAQTGADGASLTDILPKDPAVRVGKLSNGMTYYIRQNNYPAHRAELRLAVHAGSALEDDNQQGMAHFVEHMAFNGTKNFPKNKLVEFLESIGMRFGADLNAFTSFDQTIYMIQVPTDNQTSLDKGMQIIRDWAGDLSFDHGDIDAERGVVIEEWRGNLSGDQRVGNAILQEMYKGSRFAERLPIGKKEILEKGKYEDLIRYYKDWYRPDMMAVVAVGDFDMNAMEKMIKEKFSTVKMPSNPRSVPDLSIPSHEGTEFATAYDKEATVPMVQVLIRGEKQGRETVGDYRRSIIGGMISQMINGRLDEIRRQPNAPFLGAGGGVGNDLGGYTIAQFRAAVKDGGLEQGLEALMTEIERARRHGFTMSEIERTKNAMIKNIDEVYEERDKTESADYAREYYSNFTTDESFPGIAYERALYHRFIPELTQNDINSAAKEFFKVDNRFVATSGPEQKEDVDAEDLEDVVEDVMDSKIEPYKEEVVSVPLLPNRPKAGSIVSEKTISEIGVTELTLSNGVKVILKPTDFKNNEIYLTGYSPGGLSIESRNDYVAGSTATQIMAQSGIGGMDATTLRKYLSDKTASVQVGISELYETVSGSASNTDLETMFQLLYLSFTAPRRSEDAMLTFRSQLEAYLENAGVDPDQVFRDTVNYFLSGYNYRQRPITEETLNELSLDKSYDIYRKHFGDAGDFTFTIVGSFNPDEIKPLLAQYVASLPSTTASTGWVDNHLDIPTGEHKVVVHKGSEEKAEVQIVYSGPFEWSMENRHKLGSLLEVFKMKLRETLREDKGGVYSPGAGSTTQQYPTSRYAIYVFFSCDPNRVDELVSATDDIVKSMMKEKPTQEYVDKVKQIQFRERETGLKTNQFWLSSLNYYYQNGEPATNVNRFSELYKTLTPALIQEQAKKYFSTKNKTTFILLPETK